MSPDQGDAVAALAAVFGMVAMLGPFAPPRLQAAHLALLASLLACMILLKS